MADKIRVGIVGATVTRGGSGWGADAHVPALQALPEYELTAVCTAHAETAKASAEAFGAALAFHDFGEMVDHPDVDLVAVVVRVPGHHDLVVRALEAGKGVVCEWPLGASPAEAEEMADLALARGVPTAVGLQARSDPSLTYARDLVRQGYLGEILSARYQAVSEAVTERGNGRIWQGDRSNGANTLTIAGGHAIDALCFVLGEFDEVSARLATRVTEWHNTDTGETVQVDAPDWVSVSGRLAGGAEAAFLTTTVPYAPSGNRFEIYGSDGTLVITGGPANRGPAVLQGARGDQPLAPIETPASYTLVPEGTPAGAAFNVAQGYARLAHSIATGEPYTPDFAHAVTRHALIAAIEQSAAEGRSISL